MQQVTRNIDPAAARDLLERVPRACIAFAHADGSQAQPVALLWRENRYFIDIPETAKHVPAPGQEVVLLVDEGMYYFDLRAIYIRGHAQPCSAPTGAPAARSGHLWFEVVPTKTVAWDYGTLHEVSTGGGSGGNSDEH